jgi:Cu-processing system permease protein
MNAVRQTAWFVIKDSLRSRWSVANTLLFAALTVGLFYLQADGAKVVVSLSSLSLSFVPLISLIYTAMYYYNSRDFVELILTQPIGRRSVFLGLLTGLLVSLVAGFLTGIAIPYAVFGSSDWTSVSALMAVMVIVFALSSIFAALALVAAVRCDDRGKGLAVILGVWLVAAVLYDSLVLAGATALAEYPLETPLLLASLANPVDLARVLFLMHSDMAALMGYTGAVFMRFFDQPIGLVVATVSLLAWFAAPVWYGLRCFNAKDF